MVGIIGLRIDAAGCLFDLYRGRSVDDDARSSLLADLGNAIGDSTTTKTQRVGNYRALIGAEFTKYDEDAWFKEAVGFTTADTSIGGDTVPGTQTLWVWKDNYRESHWFKFQEAVKAHQAYVLTSIVRPIYAMMEQTTW